MPQMFPYSWIVLFMVIMIMFMLMQSMNVCKTASFPPFVFPLSESLSWPW